LNDAALREVESDMEHLDRYLRGRHPELSFQVSGDIAEI